MQLLSRPRLYHTLIFTVVLTVLINAALFAVMGMRHGGDTPRYLDGAARLLAGEPLTERHTAYIGYVWLLAALQRAQLDVSAAYFLHVVLSGVAGACVALGGWRLGGAVAGLASGVIWALFVDAHRWNVYLLTDGPFISLVAIAAGLAATMDRHPRLVPPAIGAIGAMAVLRLNGLVYALLLAVGGALRTRHRASRIALICLGVAVLMAPTSTALRNIVGGVPSAFARDMTLGFLTDGEVIWRTVRIEMPPPAPSTGRLANDAMSYVSAHPVAVARLYLLRLGHYLFGFNPQYSTRHIVATLVQWLLVYVLALLGVRALARRGELLAAWPSGIWLLQAVVVTLTVGDFDGRYSLYGLGSLLPVCGVGVATILERPASWRVAPRAAGAAR